MDCAAYYCEQGAIYSLDKGNTWVISEAINPEIQKYIGYIGELKTAMCFVLALETF